MTSGQVANTPTLADVFSAVQMCNTPVHALFNEVLGIKEDIALVGQDLQHI